ncbi:MAG: HXXEE domain-containing protein [bacterium]
MSLKRYFHKPKDQNTFRHSVAWFALCTALALHVLDEALSNFLDFYNPLIRSFKEKLPYLPLPTFTFDVWLSGLTGAILFLFSLTPLVFRGVKWLKLFSIVFSGFMIMNGLGHLVGSVFLGRLLPGVYSSPFLIVAAVNLLVSVRTVNQSVD